MRIHYQAPALDVSLPPLRSGWAWPPRDMLDACIGEAVFGADLGRASTLRGFARREWPAASSTITVGSRLHDELTEATPITPCRRMSDRAEAPTLGDVLARPVREARPLVAAFARVVQGNDARLSNARSPTSLSDKTMREIRDASDRVMREREAEAERAARRVERVAEVVFVSLVAIGFLIWAL